MPKLIVQLSGGLGNQMFQYASGRSIALNNNFELVIDNWSGFYRDKQYKRKYELNNFPIKGRLAKFYEILPFLYIRFNSKLKKKYKLVNNLLFGKFIEEKLNSKEHSMNFSNEIYKMKLKQNTWVKGYWQSPLYFKNIENLIHSELNLPYPALKNFQKLGQEMSNSESLALGIRLYEESKNPDTHSLNKKNKSIFKIDEVLQKVINSHPNIHVYVFCTHNSKVLKNLNLPKNVTFITHDHGFKGSSENMWLLSRCKHHIFNNSSFYWWGAWLSSANYKSKKQIIYAADNFINHDGFLKNWIKF